MGSNLVPIPLTPKKRDPAWKHCQLFKNGEKVQFRCIYCSKMFKGGGIHRIKEHLACLKGNGSTCPSVPSDVLLLIRQTFDKDVVKKRKKEGITNLNRISCENDALAHQSNVNYGLQLVGSPKTFEPCSSLLFPCPETTNNRSGDDGKKRGVGINCATPANALNFALGANRAHSDIHMAIGKFLYDIGAPLDVVNSAYFQPMIEAIASGGLGLEAPSYHDIRGWILKNSIEEVKNDAGKYTTAWASTGCSVLVDQLITDTGRILLNFSVYSPESTLFLKSVDVSDMINSLDALYELLKQVVEEVGVGNVLQVITNGEEVYMVAGGRLTETFPGLYCAPCAAHCLDLILDDFAKIGWMSSTIDKARSITTFVYNHSAVLNMVRKYTSGNDIVEPGDTHISTNFTTLKRLVSVKQSLQSMVTSQEWMDCPYSKKPEGLDMLDLISNKKFWSSCMLIIRLTNPFLRVLAMVGSKKRPAMGYIYAGMYRAKETIKKEFVKREDYIRYWNIIDRWWDRLCLPLHVAGFYLNPKYFYSTEGNVNSEIVSRVLDCIERLVPDINIQDKIMKEMNSYKTAVGDFGRKMAIRARDTLHPDEWWSTYGGGCPNLSRLAIRILSQTCSSIRFKHNKVPFEQMHGTRNCLERQRLMDLMFVQCNFQLRQMIDKTKQQDSFDPISIDSVSLLEDWVIGKDVCLGDYGSVDWPELDTPSPDAMLLAAENDEFEEISAGFDDYEILSRTKDGEEDIIDNNVVH